MRHRNTTRIASQRTIRLESPDDWRTFFPMLPFYVGRFLGAMTRAHGYAIARADGLCLALHDGKIEGSILDEETDTIVLGWNQIGELSAHHGRLQSTLTIPFTTTPPQDPRLPAITKGRMILQVQSRDRDALDTLLQRAASLRLGHQDPDVDRILDDVGDFLRDL